MVLELYTWGPAFSLPSIDPHCLATITYFSLAIPNDHWVLEASCDPKSNPTRGSRLSVVSRGESLLVHLAEWLNSG